MKEQKPVEEISNAPEEVQEYEEYNPFDAVEEALNAEGETWEGEIAAGMYMVGADLPEGEYEVVMSEGSTFEVFDASHNLFAHESFSYEKQKLTGVKLFRGAILCVDGMNAVRFMTENGQVQEMTGRVENPNQITQEISGEAVAGKDFPAGTYDILAQGEKSGIFRYEIPIDDGERDSYSYSFSVLMEKNATQEYPDYCSVYKNVVLPEGSVISTDSFTVILESSQEIIGEDESSFYNNMY